MSSEQQRQGDNVTPITRSWRLGGPMSAAQRKEAMALFIEELRRTHNVTLACDHASIARKTVYGWREKDSTFADQWEDAVERTKDNARMSIYQRGVTGWDEPIVAQGKVAVDEFGNRLLIHKWSDSLAALYAKANLPEYKDKQQIDLNAQITTMAETAKDELLADLAAAITNEDKKQSSQG